MILRTQIKAALRTLMLRCHVRTVGRLPEVRLPPWLAGRSSATKAPCGGVYVGISLMMTVAFTGMGSVRATSTFPGSVNSPTLIQNAAGELRETADPSTGQGGSSQESADSFSDSRDDNFGGLRTSTSDQTGGNSSTPVEQLSGKSSVAVPQGRHQWISRATARTVDIQAEVITQDGAELQRFRIVNRGVHEPVLFWLPQPPSLLHEELRAGLQLHATTAGIQAGLAVVLPHQTDPRTGKLMETVISGETSRQSNQWQTLNVVGDSRSLEIQLRRLRTELNRSDIVGREAYAHGIVVMMEAPPGESFVDIKQNSLSFGPGVRLPASLAATIPERTSKTGTAESVEQKFLPLKLELNRVVLDEKPVILRLTPDHGEPIETLQQMGINTVWISDCYAEERSGRMLKAGLAVLATPPHPEFEPGDFTKLLHALPPLDQLCPHVSAWYTGTRVSADQLPHLLAWSREIRSADRVLQRPQLADVISAEGAASREVDFVGIGKHIVGREESFGQLRNELFRRQRVASQMAFPWTWLQTEPSALQQTWRERHGSALPMVEPEQILMQVHTALSAGCKGIGFWKTRPLQMDNPTDQETALAIELASLEVRLLEPFLAAGRVDGHLLIQPPETETPESGRKMVVESFLQSALSSTRLSTSAMIQEQPAGPDAAVITSHGSMLILLTHWDQSSQYVPQAMHHPEIHMIVAASETASAWQLSSTGLRGLPREVVAGGLRLTIHNFDRHAAILVSSDTQLVADMERHMHSLAPRAARLIVELAELKLRRVLQTTERLHEFGAVPTNVNRLFSMARVALERSQHELRQNDFHEAALLGNESLRYLRTIQAACWKEAVAALCSPSGSPHTISFATLPDHWEMMQQIVDRRDHETGNLLPSGTFENQRLLSESGWTRTPTFAGQYSTAADVISETPNSNAVLRLAAWLPRSNQQNPVPRSDMTPLIVTSTAIPVQPGDIVRIKGRLRRGRVLAPHAERPVLLFDSEMGPESGVRLAANSVWTPFEIFREITPGTSSFHFSIALTCMAEVHVDDLSVTRLPASPDAAPQPAFGPQPTTGPKTPVQTTGQIR